MYFLISYLTDDRKYKLEMVKADSELNAVCKTIPKYKSLVDRVVATVGKFDNEVMQCNLDSIGIINYDYRQINGELLKFKEKTQVVSLNYIEGNVEYVEIQVLHAKTRVDALFQSLDALGIRYDIEELGDEIDTTDLRDMMAYVTNTTNVTVLEVSTLKRVVKKSISNA